MTHIEFPMSLTRRPELGRRLGAANVTALMLRLLGVGLLAWVGAIHLHLWQEGYRHLPTNGPLFLADAIGGFVLGAVLLGWGRPLAGIAGAAYMLSTLGALVISINFGLFGFQESSQAAFVQESIWLESVGAAVLIAWSGLTLIRRGRTR